VPQFLASRGHKLWINLRSYGCGRPHARQAAWRDIPTVQLGVESAQAELAEGVSLGAVRFGERVSVADGER
jgi:hypothetical protein